MTREKILVVDDLAQVAESVRDELSADFDVDTATSGMEALQRFMACRYDGLVVDVQLEVGISGLELVAKIRDRDPLVRVVFFSATDYSDDVRRSAVALGASFCEKPVTGDTIRRLLGAGRS